MDVLGMAQSRVSRHLAILREAGLLRGPPRRDLRRRTASRRPTRAPGATPGGWCARSWRTIPPRSATSPPSNARWRRARERTRSFFDAVGPEWDALRKVFNDDALRARAINRMIPPDRRRRRHRHRHRDPRQRARPPGPARDRHRQLVAHARRGPRQARRAGHHPRRAAARRGPSPAARRRRGGRRLRPHGAPLPALSRRGAARDGPRRKARRLGRGGGLRAARARVDAPGAGRRVAGLPGRDVREWFQQAGLGEPSLEIEASAPRSKDLPATFIASSRRPA